MNKKQKFLYVLISIITIGIYPIVVHKRTTTKTNLRLSEAKKISVNIPELIKNLGGKDNVVAVEYTHTKLKIFISDKTKVIVESINSQKGITGVVASTKSITIIVGNQAKQISKLI